MLIGFGGRAESGKTTSTELLSTMANVETHEHIEFSDPIIEVANRMLDVIDPSLLDDANYRSRTLSAILDIACAEGSLHQNESDPSDCLRKADFTRRITTENKAEFRPLLEWIGKKALVLVSSSIWGDMAMQKIDDAVSRNVELVTVGGIRSVDDCEVIRKYGGVVVKLTRNTNSVSLPTEESVDDWSPDFNVINNGSLDDLRLEIEKIWNSLNPVKTAG